MSRRLDIQPEENNQDKLTKQDWAIAVGAVILAAIILTGAFVYKSSQSDSISPEIIREQVVLEQAKTYSREGKYKQALKHVTKYPEFTEIINDYNAQLLSEKAFNALADNELDEAKKIITQARTYSPHYIMLDNAEFVRKKLLSLSKSNKQQKSDQQSLYAQSLKYQQQFQKQQQDISDLEQENKQLKTQLEEKVKQEAEIETPIEPQPEEEPLPETVE